VVPENIHITPPPPQRITEIPRVGVSERGKFPKGRGLDKEFFFPEGLKCNRISTCILLE